MNLLLTGHPRSGTRVLQQFCDGHPQIRVTYEFGTYRVLNVPILLYTLSILGRSWATRARSVLTDLPEEVSWPELWESTRFKIRFLIEMWERAPSLVGPEDIEAVLQTLFPDTAIVGDKYPNCVFNLGAYTQHPSLATIVIYRDGRDVVASYLDLLDQGYDASPVFGDVTTAPAIARQWTQAMRALDRNRAGVLSVRYERLTRQPQSVADAIAAHLDVDPAGFPVSIVRETSVGTYRERLTPKQIEQVEEVAGPTLREWGYLGDE